MHTNETPSTNSRRRRFIIGGVGIGLTAAMIGVGTHMAFADTTMFSDDFESGNSNKWSKSGGTWSVVADGSKVLKQSSASTADARQNGGDKNWTDYTLQAKVKPIELGSGTVGISARVKDSKNFYRLALRSTGAQLQTVKGTSVTELGSSSQTISAGTWYTLRLDVSSSTITGYVNGTKIASASNSDQSKGRISLQTLSATASFDDVTVTSVGSTPTPTPSSTSARPSSSPTSPTSPTSSPTQPTTPPTPVAGDIFVSKDGTDSAAGTKENPTSLASALTKVAAGKTIYMRGGTYSFSQTLSIAQDNSGTSSARKKLSAYAGETPVMDFSGQALGDANRGFAINGSYWHIYGIVVEKAGDNGIFVSGNNNILERTVTRFNRDTGLQIARMTADTAKDKWPAGNLVLSAESHDNADPDGEDADGFAAKLTVGDGNIFRYCVSHNNIDDGWDLYTKPATGPISPVTIENSLAYNNGTLTNGTTHGNGDRNGYKLGGENIGVNHIIKNNIAYKNGKHGFTRNKNDGSMTVSNNVSIDNQELNFMFDAGTSVFRNNTSCRSSGTGKDKITGDSDSSNQFWEGSNGSRCSSYSGTMRWSFASDGKLVVTFG